MFSSKKSASWRTYDCNVAELGTVNIGKNDSVNFNINDINNIESRNDSDLESELAALSGAAINNGKPKSLTLTSALFCDLKGDNFEYETLVNGEGNDDKDVDVENDPDLISELEIIVGREIPCENELRATEMLSSKSETNSIALLQQRMEMYKLAEANAKLHNDYAKVRRLNRGLKILSMLLTKGNNGENINSDDIPPVVSIGYSTFTETTGSSDNENGQGALESIQINEDANLTHKNFNVDVSKSSEQSVIICLLEKMRSRQQEYKMAALQSKREGDNIMMLEYFKVVKRFDAVIKMCQDGQEVDVSDMPPSPKNYKDFVATMQLKSDDATVSPMLKPESIQTPTTILEALQQRLAKYKSVEESAKTEGNTSKARRFGRIVKQYEESIKNYQSGRVVPYDELPVPPGFGPLPLENNASTTQTSGASTSTSTNPLELTASNFTTIPDSLQRYPIRNNLADQQMKILLERQKEFKLSAIQAKKLGEIEQAKQFLKSYKGFNKLIHAASSGLPIDLNSLPVSPSQRENLEASFAIIDSGDYKIDIDDISDIQMRVEEQLAKQLMMCKNTRDHHKAMGDIAGMNRFENLALAVQKDLDLVRYFKRNNFAIPKFHYEKRNFNIVHCNTDLADNEIEITIVRGFNYNVSNPKFVDTYVRVEFPQLNDQTFKAKTTVVKDSDNPEYDQRFTVEILRSNRQFQRIFRRHGAKFEVYSRGGFLRSDTLVGTVIVKLQPLESKCEIHDTFNLMEGRKPVGGKLEVRLRIRHPILRKQVEQLEERWLILDS